MEETAQKAQRMVGLGPLKKVDLERHMENERDFEAAKVAMVKEHLKQVYKYNQEELERLHIKETRMTNKEEIFIYIAVAEIEDIRDIYRRKAEIKRDDAMLRMYVPPQFFAKFTALNKICKSKRQEDGRMKTQLRYGKDDLEVWTKMKGDDEPFSLVNMKEFVDGHEVPDFDDKMKWHSHRDRQPRRRVSSSRQTSPARPASGEVFRTRGHSADTASREKQSNRESLGRQIRQLSLNSDDDAPAKKQKQEGSMDSCNSNDLKGALEDMEDDTENEVDITL